VKPLLTFGLPQALEKINKLETEREGFVSLTLRMESQLQQKDQELQQLRAELALSGQRETEKDKYIASLLDQVAEGVRKGWQVEELQRMIYGRRSERYIPEVPADPAATQLSLGDDFIVAVPAEVSTVPVVEPAANAPAQTPAGGTSRKQKRHVAHGVKRTFLPICPGRTAITNPRPMSPDGPRPERWSKCVMITSLVSSSLSAISVRSISILKAKRLARVPARYTCLKRG